MPYCFKCGVEVNNGVKNCPLCDLDLPTFEDEVIPEPRYPSHENVFREIKKKRRNVFYSIYTMIVLAISFNLMLIDKRTNNVLEWSSYTSIYLLSTIPYLYAILQYSKKNIINFGLIQLTTVIVLFLSDYLNGEIEWFYTLGLPISIISVFALYLVFKIFKRAKLLPYKVLELLILASIYLVILEWIIDIYLFGSVYLGWSLQTIFCFLPFMTILIFMPRKWYEKFDKYIERMIHL